MADELKPIKDAPENIRNIITKVIDHEKRNMHVRRGIKDDVVDIIKQEIQ